MNEAERRKTIMKPQVKVCAGQHYTQIMGPRYTSPLWRVDRVYEDGVQIPHACLVKVANLLQSKTISCSTLADPRFFTLVGSHAAHAA